MVAGDAQDTRTGDNRQTAVVTLTATGRLDPAFDGDGLALAPTGVPLILPDGAVVTASTTGISRLASDGRPDPAFGVNGTATIPAAGSSDYPNLRVNALTVRPDGSLAVIGNSGANASQPTDGVVLRFVGTGPAAFSSAVPGTLQVGGTADGSVQYLSPSAAGYTLAGATNYFPRFAGAARTATADVTGDGVLDYIAGPGPGGGPNVIVIDGRSGVQIVDLLAFETTFTGGVYVAAADLNGDGKAEVIVTPDQGGGPVVAVYDGAKLAAGQNDAAQLTRFFGIEDPEFRGGARPAVGDVNGDGIPDVLVAAGVGGGPRLAVFDGTRVLAPVASGLPPKLMPDIFVFEPTLRNGVYVAAGDLTGDGAAEVVVVGGPGGGPRVFALDGRALVGGAQTPVANFFVGDSDSRGGVRVAVVPDAGGQPQLVTGSGDGEPARVQVYTAAGARAGTAEQELAPFNGVTLADGVYVG